VAALFEGCRVLQDIMADGANAAMISGGTIRRASIWRLPSGFWLLSSLCFLFFEVSEKRERSQKSKTLLFSV
jgi:hypothetical protein